MSSSDNYEEIRRQLDELADGLTLTRDGLGVDLLDIITEDIEETSGRQQAPDGYLWKPNDPKYAASKRYRPVGVKSGLMLNRRELEGTRTVASAEATIEYGTDQEARDHAAAFEKGGRKLWGLSLDAQRAMGKRVQKQVDDHVKRLNDDVSL